MIELEYILAAATVLFLVGFIDLVKTRPNAKRVKVKIEAKRDPQDAFASKTKR